MDFDCDPFNLSLKLHNINFGHVAEDRGLHTNLTIALL